jgi:hypothetical protein
MEAPPSPLSSRPKWRDLQFSQPATDPDGSTDLPFVIPTEVEGSAVLSTSNQSGRKHRPSLCHPDRSGGICSSLNRHLIRMEAPPSPLSSRPKWRDLQFSQPATDPDGSTDLPFVIPTEVEGSAVLSTSNQSGRKHRPSLCHPDRSGGICSSLHQQPIRTEAPTLPLSSRPERTRISYCAAPAVAACAAFLKESRMRFANATNPNRKSGVAQWRDLRFLFPTVYRRSPS